MLKQERAAFVSRHLDYLYPQPPIPLRHRDAYTLLLAVLLSAQCTDARVNKVTPALFALADNPDAMSRLPVKKIESAIRSCGLAPQKALAIVRLSKILMQEHNGEVPCDMDALERLPGVGHKTASVVMGQAFGRPTFPVDTHIHRLAQRWGLSDGKSTAHTERSLKQLFPSGRWLALHLQMIYYGREHCTARGCDGTVCEICRNCYPRRRQAVATRRA